MGDLTVEVVLRNWAKWVNQNPLSSLCYPSIEPYRKLYKLPGDYCRGSVDEKSAELVDQLMSKMIDRAGNTAIVFALSYMTGMTNCRLSEFVKSKNPSIEIDRKKVSACIGIGRAWLDGAYSAIEMSEAA